MAGGKGIDLLMKFETSKGSCLKAEGSSRLNLPAAGKDPLLAGFVEGKTFEVFDFSFGTGVQLGEQDDKEADLKKDLADAKKDKKGNAKEIKKLEDKLNRRTRAKGRSWTFGDDFPVDMQPVSFSRLIDSASSALLWHCVNSKYFDNATLVKRRAVGGDYSGYGYLRMDFGGVMLTQINWSDDDDVKETITFVCRNVLIQYRPVLPSGELGGMVQGNWEAPGVSPMVAPTS